MDFRSSIVGDLWTFLKLLPKIRIYLMLLLEYYRSGHYSSNTNKIVISKGNTGGGGITLVDYVFESIKIMGFYY